MSITSTMNNALTGLTAVSRKADVVSQNVANAMTDGYARRQVNLSSQTVGGNGAGVRVEGISRNVNPVVLADRRLADAESGNAGLKADFYSKLEDLLGTPEDPGSLSSRVAALESTFVEAASRPDSETRLQNIVTAATNLTTKLNSVSKEIQQSRTDADQKIAQQVDQLNEYLHGVDRLNAEILSARSSGRDATGLMDERQRMVDRIAEIVPIREVPRQNDQISLFTTGGAILLEGNPAEIGFTPSGVIDAAMTFGGGGILSGVTINGLAVSPGDSGVLGGGTLGALFAVRDEIATDAQAQLDAFARDLIGRFQSPATDPTLAPGDPGLFTDGFAAFDPLNEVGIARRINLNVLVDPANGGDLWKLRDGLNAVTQGSVGDATQLNRLADALTAPVVPASGSFVGAARTTSALAADVLSQISGGRQRAEQTEVYATARQDALTALQMQDGVDTDQEMQTLLIVEQAYAANARVLQTADELIQTLIGL